METIIVFSHLRWNFVFQRPQHLLSRLSQQYRIYVIEEPIFHESKLNFDRQEINANLTVLTPRTPILAHGFHDDHLPFLQTLISEYFPDEQYIVWFYTPMALPLLQEIDAKLIVYDCMDQLSAFANPPKQLLQREGGLLAIADIVFTGGPSLFEEKSKRHSNVHCFPSSVDTKHFEAGKRIMHGLAPNGPVVGFYGVIDERFDYQLIRALAQAKPLWHFHLVGPVVKIDPALLPHADNIFYSGQVDYSELPAYLAQWDLCILPFALNESTTFISPTKTLEYMAAEHPIVSTPIKDVVDLYGIVVRIAEGHEQFITECELALSETIEQQEVRKQKAALILKDASWDFTADGMSKLLGGFLNATQAHSKRTALPQLSIPTVKTIVIGAGPTGLSAAYHLGAESLLVDKNPTVGGWCRSIQEDGFTFDYAGHIMFSNDNYVLGLYKTLLGDNLHWQNREAWVYSKNVYTRYPFQASLYGLPAAVIKECIVGAVEARYETPSKPPLDGKLCEIVKVGAKNGDDGSAEHTNSPGSKNARSQDEKNDQIAVILQEKKEQNFEDFIYKVWGRGIAKHFAIPYNKKLWTLPLTEMETSWLGGRVPLPNLEEIIDGALSPALKPLGPNARFGYPLQGGFQALMDGFLPLLQGELVLNTEVTEISLLEQKLTFSNGEKYHYQNLISTMPLPHLINLLKAEAPANIISAAEGLRHVSIRCVNLGINRENLTDKHWIYYPEQSIFHRIFVQGNASPNCNPVGGFGLTCEISYSDSKPLPYEGQELIDKCIADCIEVGIFDARDQIISSSQIDMPIAYVVYDYARSKNVNLIKNWLEGFNIHLSGRYSEWEYYNSDHAFLAGKRVAEVCSEQKVLLVKDNAV